MASHFGEEPPVLTANTSFHVNHKEFATPLVFWSKLWHIAACCVMPERSSVRIVNYTWQLCMLKKKILS
jgi:hypothetical protein